jgi:hypothetical protein
LRPLHVDLFGVLGRIRQYDDRLRRHLGESAAGRDRGLLAALPSHDLPRLKRRNDGCVPWQYAQLAIDPREYHDVNVILIGDPV